MIGADADPSGVGAQIVDTVGNRFACLAEEVVDLDFSGSPAGRYSLPLFLYWPMSSFFFRSTLTTGAPAARNAVAVSWMCRN